VKTLKLNIEHFFRRKSKMKLLEIKEIRFQICEHNPKAMSTTCPPKEPTYNEFQLNIKKQLKKLYDSKRSN
jgi:hypothetical protein